MKYLLVIVGLVAAVVGARFVRAQDPWNAAPSGAAAMSAEEQAVLGELDREKFIKARELAQKVLATNPRSFAATWALAVVHHEEEGNFARALFHLDRAERLLQAQGLDPFWHIRVLRQRIDTLGEMDRTAEQIAELDRLARLYPPGAPNRKIWPLIKQRRFAEARALAESLLTSDDLGERLSAHNGLMALQEEQRDREAGFKVAQLAIERIPDSCILHRNAGILAWERFRPQLAEDWLRRGAGAAIDDCGGTPWTDLAWHYLLAGELNQAVNALKTANTVPVRKKDRALQGILRRALLADLLFVMGKTEEAEQLAQHVYEQPERVGQTSNSAAFARLTRTLRYWLALDTRLKLEREKASYRHVGSGAVTRTKLALARWEVRRAMFQLAVEEDALITITRPNLADVHVGRWSIGGLVEILGPGVMKSAVAKARALDAAFPEATPYLDAISGEIAYREGEYAQAIALAEKALPDIPAADGLIRWYTMAWEADALWSEGEHARAVARYHEVLQKLPVAVRMLDLALPVEITHDGSGLAEDAADALGDSPRFTSSKQGLRIDLRASGKELTACLTDRHGMQFACASGTSVESALDAFHTAAFSPKVAVTQADLNSLDGSTSSRTADQVLEGLLK